MRIASLIALLLVAACAPMTTLPAPPTPDGPPSVGNIDLVDALSSDEISQLDACKAKGGHLKRVGKLQALRCIVTYSDAGKACTDGAQCLGQRCVGDFEDTAAPTPATGTCTATNDPFGCQTIIRDGKAATICVD